MPDHNFLSGPLWLISLLHVLTLTLHFLAMNFMVGGVIILLWGKLTNRWENPTVKRFVKLFPTVMAATVTLGVAPLLFMQLTYPKQVYAAAITSGWFWLGVIGSVICAYYLFYACAFSSKRGEGSRGWMLPLALLCLGYVSVVYTSVFSMAECPDLIHSLYAAGQSGWQFNPNVSEYLFRWLHMIFGAITVGSFIFAYVGKEDETAFATGKKWFLYSTIANAVIGTVYLLQLGELMKPFMRSPGIGFLTVGIVAALGALHFISKKKLTLTAVTVFVAMLSMVATRHFVRLLRLEGHYDPASMPVDPQWSVMALFGICFIIAVWTVWYMIRAFMADRRLP